MTFPEQEKDGNVGEGNTSQLPTLKPVTSPLAPTVEQQSIDTKEQSVMKKEKSYYETLMEDWKVNPNIEFDYKKINHPQLISIVRNIHSRIIRKSIADSGQDYRIVITGAGGVGKSWLAFLIGLLLAKEDFDLIKHIAYYSDSKNLINKFHATTRYMPFIVDEAIVSMDKMSFASKEYRDIVKLFATERFGNKVAILNVPSLDSLGKDIREGVIDMWINILEHGVCTVHIKPRSISNAVTFGEVWEDYKKMVRKRKLFQITTEERIKLFEKHCTHVLTIKDIPSPEQFPEWYIEYNRLKELSRKIANNMNSEEASNDKVSRWDKKREVVILRAFNSFVKEFKLSKKDAYERLGVDNETIARYEDKYPNLA